MTTRKRMVQNYLLLWVDTAIDEKVKDCQNSTAKLRDIVSDINLCITPEDCIEFLISNGDEKTFVIISVALGPFLVPVIHDMTQVDAIYIFCDNKSKNEEWIEQWIKIKGVYTNIGDICEALQMDVEQCNQNSISASFVNLNERPTDENLDQLDPTFMYTHIFKEILLEMKYDQTAVEDLANYCRPLYPGNAIRLATIDEFERTYRAEEAISWYTRQCFTYQMLNRALRNLESSTIIKMGFFIHNLHQQILQLHQQQVDTYCQESFLVYRGQGLSTTDFEKLTRNPGGLISFNNFLSTSKDKEVSLPFARGALIHSNMFGILFVMSIDPVMRKTPFASIGDVSYFQTEDEILFSMHTIFRVRTIKKLEDNDRLYQVELQLTTDDDQELQMLTEKIRKEATGDTGWERLGNLLLKIGHPNEAEELYKILLEQASADNKPHFYNRLGYVKRQQGDYMTAIENYEKALQIEENTLPPDHPLLTIAHDSIGSMYMSMGEYSKALSYLEKALAIKEKTPPFNHDWLVTTCNDIATVYEKLGECSKALLYQKKALEIRLGTLPFDHTDLATSYMCIGVTLFNMREYSTAISYYEKALDIQQTTLPFNHPELARNYVYIGLTHYQMKEYSKAVIYYEKALGVQQRTLPSDHPGLCTSYVTIGLAYFNMGEYSKAISSNEKALEIQEKTLSPNHPALATSYNSIGLVYHKMGEYSKAVSYYEKALEIQEKTLSSNHLQLATFYINIAHICQYTKDDSKSLAYFERALNIFKTSLPDNHPNIVNVQHNIDCLKKK